MIVVDVVDSEFTDYLFSSLQVKHTKVVRCVVLSLMRPGLFGVTTVKFDVIYQQVHHLQRNFKTAYEKTPSPPVKFFATYFFGVIFCFRLFP